MKNEDLVKLLSPLAGRNDIPDDARQVVGQAITVAKSPLDYDVVIYRIVVAVLGLTVLLTVFGGIYLALKADSNIKLPDGIVAIGSAAVGALAGLLAPSPKSSGG
jgi:uncharacterized integral membrane protein